MINQIVHVNYIKYNSNHYDAIIQTFLSLLAWYKLLKRD